MTILGKVLNRIELLHTQPQAPSLMSSIEKRLAVFSQLPLRAQLATITSTKANPVLSKNRDYLASLEKIHAECLAAATPEAKMSYNKARELLS